MVMVVELSLGNMTYLLKVFCNIRGIKTNKYKSDNVWTSGYIAQVLGRI